MVNRLRTIGGNITEDDIIDLPRKCKELRKMDPIEFQNLVMVKLDGKVNPKKRGDKGIDGWTYRYETDDFSMQRKKVLDAAVQVKRSDNIGRPTVNGFVGAMVGDTKNTTGKNGIFVAFSFTPEAKEYVEDLKTGSGISVKLLTTKELFDCE